MRTVGLWVSAIGLLSAGALSLLYLFTGMGESVLGRRGTYTIYADFSSASGLDPGSVVEIAGIQVGQVTAVQLTGTRARVTLNLRDDIRLQEDAIASIQTKGLLGGRYMLITPGGSDRLIPPGGRLRETESPLDLPGLMAAYVGLRNRDQSSTAENAPTP